MGGGVRVSSGDGVTECATATPCVCVCRVCARAPSVLSHDSCTSPVRVCGGPSRLKPPRGSADAPNACAGVRYFKQQCERIGTDPVLGPFTLGGRLVHVHLEHGDTALHDKITDPQVREPR